MARPTALARSVRVHMERNGLTVQDVAARAGLTRTGVSAWLNGRRGMHADSLERILDAIGKLASVRREIER